MGYAADAGPGFWYLLLSIISIIALLRLMYIPSKLFVPGNATATVNNIAAHEWLFRFGIVGDLVCGVILIFLVLTFYRLFKGVDQNLAVLVVILGGVMPALINFVNVVSDAGALMVVRGADFLSVFDKPQRGTPWPCCSSVCMHPEVEPDLPADNVAVLTEEVHLPVCRQPLPNLVTSEFPVIRPESQCSLGATVLFPLGCHSERHPNQSRLRLFEPTDRIE